MKKTAIIGTDAIGRGLQFWLQQDTDVTMFDCNLGLDNFTEKDFDSIYIAAGTDSDKIYMTLTDAGVPKGKITKLWTVDQSGDVKLTVPQKLVSDVSMRKKNIAQEQKANRIKVEEITAEGNRISYKFSVKGEWGVFFRTQDNWHQPGMFSAFDETPPYEPIFFEYSTDISAVPASVAVIPLLANIMPLVWMYDATVIVPEIDATFYYALENILDGYKTYKKGWFGGNKKGSQYISAGEIVKNNPVCGQNKALILFSGGIDAWDALIDIIHLSPTLVTLWGYQLRHHHNPESRKIAYEMTRDAAHSLSISASFIKSNFRMMLNDNVINFDMLLEGRNVIQYGYYFESIQHGLIFLGSCAPLAYAEKYNMIFIASSDPIGVKVQKLDAANPFVVENVKFGNVFVVHRSIQKLRKDKIRNIGLWSTLNNRKLKLYVCISATEGANCCVCYKCVHSWLGILSEGFNPVDFGFDLNNDILREVLAKLRNGGIKAKANSIWYGIVKNFNKNENVVREISSESIASIQPLLSEIIGEIMKNRERFLAWQ